MNNKTNSLDSEVAEFAGANQEAIIQLATFAHISQGFTLAFAEVNFALDVPLLVQALKGHRRCKNVQFVVIRIDDPELEFVLSAIKERLQAVELDPTKKLVLIVVGLERAIGYVDNGKTPEVIANLNFARDLFPRQLPYPVVFVLPDYALTRLARGAHDLWAWTSASVQIRSGRQTIKQAHQQVFEPNRSFSSDAEPVKQERIDLLQRLLTQYQPTLGKLDAELAPLRLNILEELADAYLSLSNVKTAQHFYAESLSLAQSIEKKWSQASALLGLGKTLSILNTRTEALNLYNKALTLYRDLEDPWGEANALKAIGDALLFLKQAENAMSYYEKSFALYQEVSDQLGKANVLLAIGDVLQVLDRYQDALPCYEQALISYRAIEDRLGEANTLLMVGGTLQVLDQPQEALNRYKQALAQYQDVGNGLGKANTLLAIGDVLQVLDQPQEALKHYEQALTLYPEIGDHLGEANTLQAIGDVLVQQEDLGEATFQQGATHLETAHKLYCEIGDRYSQARILLTSIAPLKFRLGQRQQAIAALTKAAELAAEIGYEPMQQHAADMLKTLQQKEA
jgi:tetratricopeptide (TPR) repeat protein